MKKTRIAGLSVGFVAVVVVAGCASSSGSGDALQSIKASFAERGVAKLDRLEQTEIQRTCTAADVSGKALDDKTRARIQNAVLASIKYPQDGNYLGDWRQGERIAQNGRGLQWSDTAAAPNGANCYACHQLSPQEISYGNQGPSLLRYGQLRGVKDPKAAESQAIVKYTWGRIWNTHAFNACSNMPRFGDAGILTTEQIKHVMALLLSPDSPVNK